MNMEMESLGNQLCNSNFLEESSEGSNDEEIQTNDTGLEVTKGENEVLETPMVDNTGGENSNVGPKEMVNNLGQNILDAQLDQERNISQRDYFFGTVQKIFGLCLPKIYAIYCTLLFNFLLSLANASSDIGVFWYLMNQQHPKAAYVILGKNAWNALDVQYGNSKDRHLCTYFIDKATFL